MIQSELLDEFVTLTHRPNGAELAWLHGQGIQRSSPLTGLIQKGYIEFHETFFEFNPSGEPTFIHTVSDAEGGVIDLIAWKPSNPARWWLRTGIAIMLGEVAVNSCYAHESPLRIHRTPLQWLRWGGWGVVSLDWPSVRLRLLEIPELIAEDFQHGIEIEDQLRGPIPPSPKIQVPSEIKRAA